MSAEKNYMTFEFGEGDFKFEEFNEDKPQEKTVTQAFTVEIGNETKQMFNNMESMMKEYFEQLKTWFKSTFSEADSAKILDKMTELDTKFQEAPTPAPVVTVDFKESAEYKEMVAKQEASEAELAKMRETTRRNAWDNFIESEIDKTMAAGKLTPAQKPTMVNMANMLYNSQNVEFSDNGSVVKDTKAAKEFTEFLGSMPEQVSFSTQAGKREEVIETSEFAGANVDENSMEVHKKVRALMRTYSEKGTNISYAEALNLVMAEEN